MIGISETVHATEDYLKAIYALTKGEETASTNAIAEAPHIAPASVTGMLKRLAKAQQPLIDCRKHRLSVPVAGLRLGGDA